MKLSDYSFRFCWMMCNLMNPSLDFFVDTKLRSNKGTDVAESAVVVAKK
jgi:hypothetical protein